MQRWAVEREGERDALLKSAINKSLPSFSIEINHYSSLPHPCSPCRFNATRIRIHLQPSAPESSETGLKSPGSRGEEEVFREGVLQPRGSRAQPPGRRAPAPGKRYHPRPEPPEGRGGEGREAPCLRKSSLPLNRPVKINKYSTQPPELQRCCSPALLLHPSLRAQRRVSLSLSPPAPQTPRNCRALPSFIHPAHLPA